MGRLPHPQLIESIISGQYAPRAGRQIDVTGVVLAEKMRARADVISSHAKDESNELTEAATLLEAGHGGMITLGYVDAALLVGPFAAMTLTR